MLNTLSIKRIVSISEKVGKLKYIRKPELKIDFNTQCLIKSLQTRLEDYNINMNTLQCLELIKNPDLLFLSSDKIRDKNLSKAGVLTDV